jgi:N-acetylglucosamine-6-phosphate deacetylase
MVDLLLAHARVRTPEQELAASWVAVSGGRIAAIGQGVAPRAAETADLRGRLLVPGFLDLHVHGGGGDDFMDDDPEACARAARFHVTHGTTGLLATTVSAAPERLQAAVRGIAAAMEREPLILGIHVEGPWLSERWRGAQEAVHLRPPDPTELRALIATSGATVRLVSLAPELPGALELVAAIAAAGAVAGLAHTDATYAQARAAVAAGARHATHVFNAMRPLHHREPGLLGAVLDDPQVSCEVIADGHHVHPAIVRLLRSAKGARATVLVTDAIAAAGLGDGSYHLGDTPIEVRAGRAQTPAGTLAGSTLTMDAAVRNACAWGVPLAEALAMASTTPARVLGLGRRKGAVAVGHDADLTVLDAELRAVGTLVGGRWASPLR